MDDENIIQLPGTERDLVPIHLAEKLNVNDMLTNIIEDNEYDEIIVIGVKQEGGMNLHSSNPDMYKTAVLLERTKMWIVENCGD